jgi:hypothetical protein
VTCSPANSAGRTLVGHGIDAGKLLDENAKRFAAKWGKTKPDGRNIELEAWSSWFAWVDDFRINLRIQIER